MGLLPKLPDLPKVKNPLGNVDLSLTYEMKEMNQLLVRCGQIEKECLPSCDKKGAIEEIEDDFLRTKALMYTNMHECKETVKERHEMQKKHGNNVETIKKKAQITDQLRSLEIDMKSLQDVYKKQTKTKKKFSQEELDNRFQDIQVLRRQIDELTGLANNTNQYAGTEIKTLSDIRTEAAERGEGRFGPEGAGTYEEASEEDKATMARWKERDAEFDKQLDLIGQGVDRLGDIAVQIGEKADEQKELITELHTEADVASDDLIEMNDRIKKIMGDSMGFNCCCKVILAIILIVLIGIAMSLISSKIKFAAIT
eukprot:Selendium_serpulae@DN4265_c0_g1_i2.p1